MDDLTEIKASVKIINDELGETQKSVAKIEGQMIWIRILLIGILSAILAQYFI